MADTQTFTMNISGVAKQVTIAVTDLASPPAPYTKSSRSIAVANVTTPLQLARAGDVDYDLTLNPAGVNPITLMTDRNTDPTFPNHSWMVTKSGNNYDNIFSQWDGLAGVRYLAVCLANDGRQRIVQFDASTLQPRGMVAGFLSDCSLSFSRTDPNTFYYVQKGTTILMKGVLNGVGAPSFSQVFDFRSCGLPPGAPGWQSPLSSSVGDGFFCMAFSFAGGQDTATYVCTVRPEQFLWSVYNTLSGEVGVSGGPLGTVNIAARFKLHEAVTFGGPIVISVAGGGCIAGNCTGVEPKVIWYPGTLQAALIDNSNQAEGHFNGSATQLFNLPNSPQVARRAYATPTVSALLNNSAPIGGAGESHICAGDDHGPIFLSTARAAPPFVTPGRNEILGVDRNAVAGQWMMRICHTFNSAAPAYWNAAEGNAALDQERRLIAFVTDNLGAFGLDAKGLPATNVCLVRMD